MASAARSSAWVVSLRPSARVTQPAASSSCLAAAARSSTVSSTVVCGGSFAGCRASTQRVDRWITMPRTLVTVRWLGTVTRMTLVGLSARPASSAAVS